MGVVGSRLPPRLQVVLIFVLVLTPLMFPGALAGASTAGDPPAGSPDVQSHAPYAPGEVLIGWAPEAGSTAQENLARRPDEERRSAEWRLAAQSTAARTGLPVLDVHPRRGWARLAVRPGSEEREIAHLKRLPWVSFAEPNYIVHAAATPDDPPFAQQWNMQRVGAQAAWDLTMGEASLTVAVIDSGIDLDHTAFAGRLLEGYDYVNQDDAPDDDFGHGTHVAGILAAEANNSTEMNGLAPNVSLLPLKVLDARGSGFHSDIASAIYYAVDYPTDAAHRARIINLSLGSSADSATLGYAVDYAISKGVLVVAAAGNVAQSGNPVFYPAAYQGVLAVGASDFNDNWAPYSNYHPYTALAAPGGTNWAPILSTWPGNAYSTLWGTSMAVPMVSGAAALAWSVLPEASAAQIADILESTADKVGNKPYDPISGRNDYFGYGRLDAGDTVRYAYPPSLVLPNSRPSFMLDGSPVQYRLQVRLDNPSLRPVTWRAQVTSGADWLGISPSSGQVTHDQPAVLTLKAGPSFPSVGQYTAYVEFNITYPNSGNVTMPVELWVSDTIYRTSLPLVMH